MASLKEVKGRINSVNSTKKITSAMKMVASAKLHKAQVAIENMLPYQQKLNEMVTNFLAAEHEVESPLAQQREVKRVAIVVVSSNSSLCGAFNANVIKKLTHCIEAYQPLGKENILLYPIGKKVEKVITKLGYQPQGSYQELANKPTYAPALELANLLMSLYLNKEVDKIELIYQHFKSTGSQVLTLETFLPFSLDPSKTGGNATTESAQIATNPGYLVDYLVEPSREEVLVALLPKVLSLKIFTMMLDSNASEHAARTIAMQVATDNASDLIQDLTILYNKSRQQAITNELLDIIGGSMK